MVIYYNWYHGYQYRRVWWRINRLDAEPHVIDIPIGYEPPVDTIGEMYERAESIVEAAVLKASGFKHDTERNVSRVPIQSIDEVILSHRYEMEIL